MITPNYSELLDQLKAAKAPAWSADNERVLLGPYDYLTTVPGKEIRSAFIDAFNAWLKVPEESLKLIKLIVQQLHTASLLMDDVEDGSELRRGIPVAHKIYGVPQTINSANYVYFLALHQLAKLHGVDSLQVFLDINEELLNLHRGQGIELHWREHLQCPTEEEYIGMVNNKTGGLFRIAIKLMLASAAKPPAADLLPLVNLIGILFQIQDDYQNLQSDTYSANKGFAEDLTEGKFSFPVVHSIRNSTNMRLLNVLKQRPTDHATKTWAVAYMRDETKSLDYTRKVVLDLKEQAINEIARLGGQPQLEKILDLLVA